MTTIVTHDGSFHADDVFAVATLKIALKDTPIHIARSREQAIIDAAEWVVDVGREYDPDRQRFDHHQTGAPVRDNGISYAAFGLVWKHLGESLCGSHAVADRIDAQLVQPVDAGDNGVSLYTLNDFKVSPFEMYQVIGSFAPAWGSGGSDDESFMAAVAWAEAFLQRIIAQQIALQTMEEIVLKTYQAAEQKRILVFDVPISVMAAVQFPDVEVVVYPDESDTSSRWKARTVVKEFGEFDTRVTFPTTWCGQQASELQEVSGIPDAVFCHKAGFLCVTESKESALKAAMMAK